MRRIHPSGLYEAICPVPDGTPDSPYQFRVVNDHGDAATIHDPYGFPSFLSDYDIYLFGEGTHGRAYERLGAQIRTVQGVTGVNFCTWAPNAVSVSIIGDFNEWDGRRHPLQKRGTSGLWELFVPEIGAGQRYKLRLKTCHGHTVDKADPFGFAAELPPRTASIVADLGALCLGR